MQHDLRNVPAREILPGFRGQFIHSDTMTFVYWSIDPGNGIPTHSHLHEQVVNVLEGELELTVAGTRHVLTAGQIYVIPGHVEHSAKALTPVREDYR